MAKKRKKQSNTVAQTTSSVEEPPYPISSAASRHLPGSLLCDTGFLLALTDPSQIQHQECQSLFKEHLQIWPTAQLISSWPCFTEAIYLAHRQGGWPLQQKLAELIQLEILTLHTPCLTQADYKHLFALMEQYQNVPWIWPMPPWSCLLRPPDCARF